MNICTTLTKLACITTQSLKTHLASEKEKSVSGRKLCKARVSLMCGAKALGSHHLKPIIVGKAKQPQS